MVSAIAASRKHEPRRIALRTREGGAGGRVVFAAVSPRYTPFDADQMASAIAEATRLIDPLPRGTVTYDGRGARFEILFHSTVQPEGFVAGEFFRAGVVIRSDDTGAGGIRGSAVVWQNLCLNLIVVQEDEQLVFSLMHVGSFEELVARFTRGFHTAMGRLDHFTRQWGFAQRENVLDRARVLDAYVPVSVSEALPGLFNGLIERELVTVRGNREEAVRRLVTAWEADHSSAKAFHDVSRASIVNALTRVAHEDADAADPFFSDTLEIQAGALLRGTNGRSPAPLPWIALDAKPRRKRNFVAPS
jgi:hypothetical protein